MREYLAGLGYEITEQDFTLHPSALLGFPLFGVGLAVLAVVATPLLLRPGIPDWGAGLFLAAGLALLGGIAWRVGVGDWPPRIRGREDANLIVTRGSPAGVRRWLVAHLDSKAQGLSMAARLIVVWLLAAALLLLGGLAVARLVSAHPVWPPMVGVALGLALTGGWGASRGRLRGVTRGARDNASGVLALAEAARWVTDPAIGFLITGAEEFGLVGSRMFAGRAARLDGTEVINLDTLADRGRLHLVYHEGRGQALARVLLPELAHLGAVRARRLPLGILVDSLPLARAGSAAVTVSRLDWSVLRRMHTPDDGPVGLNPETAIAVGACLGRLALRDR